VANLLAQALDRSNRP